MQTRAWVYFWLIGLIWGSSFLLIRIGVEKIHPFHLVLIRVGVAAIGLNIVVVATRKRIPRDWKTLRSLIIIGIGNNALPYTLLAWGEKTVESGLASVLQATAALFGLVTAHFAFEDERITRQKVAGLLMGFFGVVVLASRNWQGGQVDAGGLIGQLAIIGTSLCYALSITYSRKVIKQDVEPVVVAAIAMMSAVITETLLILVTIPLGVPITVSADLPTGSLLAVVALGFFNTFVVYLMFYDVVKTLGAARAMMVTYVVPVVGLILGVVFLSELLDVTLILGALLIFAGIGIVNLRWKRKQKA